MFMFRERASVETSRISDRDLALTFEVHYDSIV